MSVCNIVCFNCPGLCPFTIFARFLLWTYSSKCTYLRTDYLRVHRYSSAPVGQNDLQRLTSGNALTENDLSGFPGHKNASVDGSAAEAGFCSSVRRQNWSWPSHYHGPQDNTLRKQCYSSPPRLSLCLDIIDAMFCCFIVLALYIHTSAYLRTFVLASKRR